MNREPEYRLPTVEEVLGGTTQGGVPRPAVSFYPRDAVLIEQRTYSAGEIARPARIGRWQAAKALVRIIIWGDRP